MSTELSPSQKAWVPSALELINARESFDVRVTGRDAAVIVRHIADITARLPVLEMFKGIQRLIPVVGVIPVDPQLLVAVLASMGALGGACGAVAFVVGVAAAHGCKPTFVYDPGALFDPTDDALIIRLEAHAP